MKNVKFWAEAKEQGFDMGAYPYQADKVPAGTVEAVLDGKIWAKQQIGIGCYFTEAGTGVKFLLTVYRDKLDQRYRIKDCPIDFTCCPVGPEYKYRLDIDLNGKGNPFLRGARLLEPNSGIPAPAIA